MADICWNVDEKGEELSSKRLEMIWDAAAAGASVEVLDQIRTCLRVTRKPTIILPRQRLENLSRGRGWCRQGRGDKATWGEREDEGYRVGPGKWVVGGNDGFNRKGEDHWEVKHLTIGTETWTIAN